MIATMREDGTYTIGDQFGDFVNKDELHPWERTVPAPRVTKHMRRNVKRVPVDDYVERVVKLSEIVTFTSVERAYEVSHSTLSAIADGETKSIRAETKKKLDRALEAYGL